MSLLRSFSTGVERANKIRSNYFFAELQLLRGIRTIILNEGVKVDQAHVGFLNLSELDVLYSSPFGRPPSSHEWNLLNERILTLFSYLDEKQRTTVRLATSGNILLPIPVALFLMAVIGLQDALFPADFERVNKLFSRMSGLGIQSPELEARYDGYIIWLVALGAMGAVSYIYVNALRIKVDPDVDVRTPNVIIMRCILGGLFSVMLMLPLGFPVFQEFCDNIISARQISNTKDGLILIIPFVVGFSSPLVLAILDKLIHTTRLFFGLEK